MRKRTSEKYREGTLGQITWDCEAEGEEENDEFELEKSFSNIINNSLGKPDYSKFDN